MYRRHIISVRAIPLLLFFACCAFCQNTQTTPQKSSQSRNGSQQPSSASPQAIQTMQTTRKLKGCIVSRNGKFLLVQGGEYVAYLEGSDQIAQSAGHEADLRGDFTSTAQASTDKSHKTKIFHVDALTQLPETCSKEALQVACSPDFCPKNSCKRKCDEK